MAYTLSNRATELIKELKRSNWIPKYNVTEDSISSIFEEMDKLIEDILNIYQLMEGVASEMPAEEEGQLDKYSEKQEIINGYNIMMNIHHCTFYHDKRCLFAYLKHRLNKIREYRWEKGIIILEEIESILSKGELSYLQKYDQVLSTYMQRTGFDLTANMFPPHSIFVEVVSTQDYGQIVTTSGTVNLEKNSIHYLRLSDIEYLIRQGVLIVKKSN